MAAKLALVSRKACSKPSVAPSASDLRQAGVSMSAATAKLAAPRGSNRGAMRRRGEWIIGLGLWRTRRQIRNR
jgi:hypothetical protein